MVQVIVQTLFVLCSVPFGLAALWLLGVPYTRQSDPAVSAHPAGNHRHPEGNERNLETTRLRL